MYELLADDAWTIIFVADDFDSMWTKLADFKSKQFDNNIDGCIIRNVKTAQWDYAWRVALNMRDLRI
jgi:hypothetical protein